MAENVRPPDPADPFAREAEVTAEDRENLVQAIKAAYPNRDFFYSRLARALAIHVADDVIALNNPGTLILRAVVDYATAQGKVLELLGAAWTEVPKNSQLLALADRFFSDKAAVIAKFAPPEAKPEPIRQPLEKLVAARSRLLDLGGFVAGLERLGGALCMIDTGVSKGTGFLIGRRTVLTNFHVVQDAIAGDFPGEDITCTFDFADAAKPNVPVSAAHSWQSLKSRYSQSDLTATGEPGEGELDFALITLAADVESARAPLPWPTAAPIVAQRDFLVIGQHPGGGTARIAFGEVVELPKSGLRYRYDVTTGPGSSGAPVLDMNLRLVGLHHAADPDQAPRFNQAVPIARIMALFAREKLNMAEL